MICSCQKWQAGVGRAHRAREGSVRDGHERLWLDNRFDGDAVNVSIALDNYMTQMWHALHPMFNVLELTNPLEVSSNISISKTVIGSTSNWLSNDDDPDVM